MFIVDQVSKVYKTKVKKGLFRRQWNEVRAVDQLSFELKPGQILGLLGINGAGKTTTIKMCSTLLQPTSGRIEVDGLDAIKDDIRIKGLVNMIAGGERMLYWRLTGRENLEYFASLYGLDNSQTKDQIKKLMHDVELEEAADVPVERYSKGMKQRLQIARGLINDPKYIFLDEPTLGLDAPIAKHLRQYVKKMAREQGKAILLTSHYMQEVEELCDEVLIIDKGKLIAHDSPENLARSMFKQHHLRVTIQKVSDDILSKLRLMLQRYRGELHLCNENGQSELLIRSEMDLTSSVLEFISIHQLSVIKITAEQPKLEDVILHLAGRRSA